MKNCNDCLHCVSHISNDYRGTIVKLCNRSGIDKGLDGISIRGCTSERSSSFPLDILRGECGKRARYYKAKSSTENELSPLATQEYNEDNIIAENFGLFIGIRNACILYFIAYIIYVLVEHFT